MHRPALRHTRCYLVMKESIGLKTALATCLAAWAGGSVNAQVTFTDTIIHEAGTGGQHGRGLALGDFNGDGEVDLVVSNPSLNLTTRAWALAGPNFEVQSELTIPNMTEYEIFPGQGDPFMLVDLNGDGLDDLLMGSRWSTAGSMNQLVGRLLIGIAPDFNQWIGLQHPAPGQVIEFGASAVVHDFTGDGVPDVAVGSPRALGHRDAVGIGRIDVFDGNQLDSPAVLTFQPPTRGQFADNWGRVMLLEDWFGDGQVELLINDRTPPPDIDGFSFLDGKSPAPYNSWDFDQSGNWWRNELAADMNGDGYCDVLVASSDSVALAYGPTFETQQFFNEPPNDPQTEWGEALAVGDVNRDGHPDILIGAFLLDHPVLDSEVGLVRIFFGPDFVSFQGLWGAHEFAQFGTGIRTIDLNDDGFDELIIAAGSEYGGRVHLFQHETLRVLTGQQLSISSGGVAEYSLEVGALGGNQQYLVTLSASGSEPGVELATPQGSIKLPINPDGLTYFALAQANEPMFEAFLGTTDSEGMASPRLVLSPLGDPSLVGVVVTAAGVLFDDTGALDYVTDAAEIELVQ
jgi:hypothetical protein